jgi:hypothetical protein
MAGEALPEADEGNAGIWHLLMILDTQWLTGFNGKYGINLQAVIEAARELKEELDLEIDLHFFHKVKAFETEILKQAGGNGGPCSEEKKNQCREIFGEFFESTCKKCEVMKHGGQGSEGNHIG